MSEQLMILPPHVLERAFGKSCKKRGHAAQPGSGPKGETCKTCAHLYRHRSRSGKIFRKCDLVKWTFGPATDIRAGDPACSFWESQNEG
ncbi:MAG: hypothetical protein CMM61_15655 [Rhodospirillaceae bacterium]|nr:hypothetical protein [Rhodospirillaceae bacterium]